jgi:cytochrome c oxidase assembly protein subunit 15
MIILGGFTRLTGSGLSITEWNVISGILPPLSHEDWLSLFSKYQEIPEFKKINFSMDVFEFKQIFWLEYLHRILGRVIGLITILGFFAFVFKKNFSLRQKLRIIFVTIFIPVQGLVGWLMVKSGLTHNVDVSHYLLALHLTMAFLLLFILARFYFFEQNADLPKTFVTNFVKLLRFIISILFLQVIYGAFVAGLKAGLIYNQFPNMGSGLVPDEFYDNAFLSLASFDNPAIVQFIHRNLAYFLILLFTIFGFKFYQKLNSYQQTQYKLVFLIILVQIVIGVSVLLSFLNMYLAVLHQFVAAILVYKISWFYMSLLKDKNDL